jgi:hypothetical protein
MKTRLFVCTLLCALAALTTGCPRLHSPLQEELARDVQARYKTLSPSAVQALEGLDADLEKLIESQRADFEVYKETSESQLVTTTWGALNNELRNFELIFSDAERSKLDQEIKAEEVVIASLEKQSGELSAAVKKLNEGLKEAEKQSSLKERLDEANRVIDTTLSSVGDTLDKVQKDSSSPLSERLSITIKGLNDFLAEVRNKPEMKGRVFSLVIEAMRLGRDIAALEKEVIEQEASYHENVKGLLEAKKSLMPSGAQLGRLRRCLELRYPPGELVQTRVARLAYEAGIDEEAASKAIVASYEKEMAEQAARRESGKPPAPPRRETPTPPAAAGCDEDEDGNPDPLTKADELRSVLDLLARIQSLRLTNDMRVKELELRAGAEKYRNVKLKETIFERQRMTLVSFGLVGVVRYAEGGLRSEDIGNLINIARAIAEGVIAARI